MPAHSSRSLAARRGSEQPSPRFSLGEMGRRVAKALRGPEGSEPGAGEGHLAAWLGDERGSVGEEVLPRFPRARLGYDCGAVDAHVAQLERELAEVDHELAELRGRGGAREEVEREIQRIGEQTSTVLIAAHEQREQMLQSAQAEADRCVADAKATAQAATADGEARLRELEAQTEATHRERDRLLEDVRTVTAALVALVDSAHERIGPKSAEAPAELG